MINCDETVLLLPEYVGKSTTKHQNAEIAMHISLCSECRRDLAFWLSLSHASKTSNMPSLAGMFDKLPKKETQLSKILNSRSPNMAFDLLKYTFEAINDTCNLARSAMLSFNA